MRNCNFLKMLKTISEK